MEVVGNAEAAGEEIGIDAGRWGGRSSEINLEIK